MPPSVAQTATRQCLLIHGLHCYPPPSPRKLGETWDCVLPETWMSSSDSVSLWSSGWRSSQSHCAPFPFWVSGRVVTLVQVCWGEHRPIRLPVSVNISYVNLSSYSGNCHLMKECALVIVGKLCSCYRFVYSSRFVCLREVMDAFFIFTWTRCTSIYTLHMWIYTVSCFM